MILQLNLFILQLINMIWNSSLKKVINIFNQHQEQLLVKELQRKNYSNSILTLKITHLGQESENSLKTSCLPWKQKGDGGCNLKTPGSSGPGVGARGPMQQVFSPLTKVEKPVCCRSPPPPPEFVFSGSEPSCFPHDKQVQGMNEILWARFLPGEKDA